MNKVCDKKFDSRILLELKKIQCAYKELIVSDFLLFSETLMKDFSNLNEQFSRKFNEKY